MVHSFISEKMLQYGYFFFLSAFTGFVWEVLLTLIENHSIVKRGFFYGPWLPIYGLGGVLIYLFLHPLKDRPFLCFLLSAAIGTLLELCIGLFTQYVYHLRYWNYTGYPLNYLGQICLTSSIGFGAAGFLWVTYLSNYALSLWNKLSAKKQKALMLLLFLFFSIDCLIAIPMPNTGRGITG